MFDWFLNTPLILGTMFKADNNKKKKLKHEICSKFTLKPPEKNPKNNSIMVKKPILKVRRSNK